MSDKMICLDCGTVFGIDEVERVQDYRGECWGQPAYEEELICPHCKSSDIEDAEECEICGSWCSAEELYDNGGICTACLETYSTDKECFEACERNKETESIEINSYLAYMFSESEIEDILLEELAKSANSTNVKKLREDFIKENCSVFIKG